MEEMRNEMKPNLAPFDGRLLVEYQMWRSQLDQTGHVCLTEDDSTFGALRKLAIFLDRSSRRRDMVVATPGCEVESVIGRPLRSYTEPGWREVLAILPKRVTPYLKMAEGAAGQALCSAGCIKNVELREGWVERTSNELLLHLSVSCHW